MRLWVAPLRPQAYRQHWAASRIEVIKVEAASARAEVNEMAKDKVHIDDEIAGDLPLQAQAGLDGGSIRQVRSGKAPLLVNLNVGNAEVAVVGIAALLFQLPPNPRQHLHQA